MGFRVCKEQFSKSHYPVLGVVKERVLILQTRNVEGHFSWSFDPKS